MVRQSLMIACALLSSATLAAGALDGKWHGRGTVSETAIKLWLDVRNDEGSTKLVLDFIIGQGMARIGDEDGDPRYEGDRLLWKVEAGSFGSFLCEAIRIDDNNADATCKKGEDEVVIVLVRFEGNKWLSDNLEISAADEREKRYVDLVAKAAKAMSVDDFDMFDSYFVDNPKGTLPKELFRRAFFVTMKFGQIQKIAFHEFDEPGAFVTVHFAENKRDFYIDLDEAGKIIELTYVPQPDPHFQ